jgi:hypothetical protein
MILDACLAKDPGIADALAFSPRTAAGIVFVVGAGGNSADAR